jgi:hypothetical protein
MVDYNEPIFDPLGVRVDTHYFPGNPPAQEFANIQLIWRDVESLRTLRAASKVAHVKNILTKYLMMELCSLDEVIRPFANSIILRKEGYPSSPAEINSVKSALKGYNKAAKSAQPLMLNVRHKMAAHRETISLTQMVHHLDVIQESQVSKILDAAKALIGVLFSVDIYVWTKSEINPVGESVISIRFPVDPNDITKLRDV